ncbi:MAG TPA: hypothetical protein VGJ78_13080 [Vicinamibacterales bacterium]|jgi:hypothetical protein
MRDRHAPSREIRPHVPTEVVSFDGAALLWIDAILLVPVMFGVIFLPTFARAVVLSVAVALVVTYVLLYSWSRVHPASAGAHLLERLHIGPRPSRV